jgi:hypothetical protein
MKSNRRKLRPSRMLQIEQLEIRTLLTGPTITSISSGSLPENQVDVETLTVSDTDTPTPTLTFSISGGADEALFTIDPSTGALAFLSAPDFEHPLDAGADNVYNVDVTVSDGNSGSDTQDIAVTITGINDNAPVFTSLATASVPETTTSVTTVVATDADLPAQTLAYSISGGVDAALFSINSSTGVLAFLSAPDFEAPTDSGANNVYNVNVTADDGNGLTTVQDLAVTVTPVDDFAPVISSSPTFNVTENSTAVGTVVATDGDLPAQTLTYSISGGVDATFFTVNAGTGALSFLAAPDFEAPADSGLDNVYNLQVTVNDGTGSTAVQNIAVTVVNLPPVFSSPATFSIPENTAVVGTVTATDSDSTPQPVTYSITGGADMARFSVDATTGVLAFLTAPDFDVPGDTGGDNIYNVQVSASDGVASSAVQNIAVTVTPVNDNSPVFTSSATLSLPENTTAVGTVAATDADKPVQTLSYTIAGGVDSALFSINSSTGALSFIKAPDFEAPTDANTDNVYDVSVTADDGNGLTTTQPIAVTVQNALPVFTSSGTFNVPENSTTVGTVAVTDSDAPLGATFSITGGDDGALFSINANTGVLRFLAAPDFETPLDTGADNIYNVQVTASDGTASTGTQNIAVNVTNLQPVFSSPATFGVNENTSAAGTIIATDPDTPASPVTYSITGGADLALFSVDATSGALSFRTPPDFDAPTDTGADNVYNVQVTATTASGAGAVQAIAVTVAALNDNAPVFTSSASFSVPENTAAVGTVTATDADLPAQTLTYTISGGPDAALFSVDPASGALAFLAALDYETPLDVGVDNVYNVDITADDGHGLTTTQSVAVTVTPLNDNAPVFTSAATFSVPENSTAVGNIKATDADMPGETLSYSITGGADEALFSVDQITGVLTFKVAPDFEHPTDAGADNIYNVTVTADDNGGKTTDQALTVTVTNVDEAPTITLNPATATYYLHKDHALVSPTATFVTESTTADFTGAKLVASITSNRHVLDELSIYPKGNHSGQINVKGHRVLYGGVVIGRVHGGRGAQSELDIKFNSKATAASINQLVKQINFTADSRASIGSTRTVQMQLIESGDTNDQCPGACINECRFRFHRTCFDGSGILRYAFRSSKGIFLGPGVRWGDSDDK